MMPFRLGRHFYLIVLNSPKVEWSNSQKSNEQTIIAYYNIFRMYKATELRNICSMRFILVFKVQRTEIFSLIMIAYLFFLKFDFEFIS